MFSPLATEGLVYNLFLRLKDGDLFMLCYLLAFTKAQGLLAQAPEPRAKLILNGFVLNSIYNAVHAPAFSDELSCSGRLATQEDISAFLDRLSEMSRPLE